MEETEKTRGKDEAGAVLAPVAYNTVTGGLQTVVSAEW